MYFRNLWFVWTSSMCNYVTIIMHTLNKILGSSCYFSIFCFTSRKFKNLCLSHFFHRTDHTHWSIGSISSIKREVWCRYVTSHWICFRTDNTRQLWILISIIINVNVGHKLLGKDRIELPFDQLFSFYFRISSSNIGNLINWQVPSCERVKYWKVCNGKESFIVPFLEMRNICKPAPSVRCWSPRSTPPFFWYRMISFGQSTSMMLLPILLFTFDDPFFMIVDNV